MKKTKKEPVYLRQRTRAKGLVALYLEYVIDGKQRTEYLKLYLVPERTKEDRDKNRQTLAIANSVKAQRTLELQNMEHGLKSPYAEDTLFFDYYRALVEKRRGVESNGNWGNWMSCLKHLERYEKRRDITFADITQKWVQGFRDYLAKEAYAYGCDARKRGELVPLSQNSRQSYFNKLRACLNQAFEDRIIPHNPVRGVEGFAGEESTRMYLTIEEVQRAANTKCDVELIKRAFLFSCLTGLRKSDVMRISWADITEQSGYTRIIFRQKKTKGQEYLDIAPEAVELLGERGELSEQPFGKLPAPSSVNYHIKIWMQRSGIDKPITFHCARHTFAVMMLDLGTDIYTVSKLLGHRELSTTQIYAKVLDKNKQAAVSRIPSVLAKPKDDDSE